MRMPRTTRKLIRRFIAEARRFRFESRVAHGEAQRELFGRLSAKRAVFAARLGRFYESGPTVTNRLGIGEALREVGVMLRDAIGCRNDGDAIASCRRAEGRIEGLYSDAIAHASGGAELSGLLEQKAYLESDRRDLLEMQF